MYNKYYINFAFKYIQYLTWAIVHLNTFSEIQQPVTLKTSKKVPN